MAVTAIIPTRGNRERSDVALRAISSLQANTVQVRVLCVVNGNGHDGATVEAFRAAGAEVMFNEAPSAPLAVQAGRRTVTTPYFCFLDDDDEYLPRAIDRRLARLAQAPDADFMVANGYRCVDGADEIALKELPLVERAPLHRLFEENWMPSCAGLFRTDRVGNEFFARPHPYMEWTWLAYRLALAGRRVAVLDEPTFRIHDSQRSLSKSQAYRESQEALCRRMLETLPPREIREVIQRRLQDSLASGTVDALAAGDVPTAWRLHRQVLNLPGGWHYFTHTLRIAAAALRPGRG